MAQNTSIGYICQSAAERDLYNSRYAQIASLAKSEADLIMAHLAAQITIACVRRDFEAAARIHDSHESAIADAGGDCCCPESIEELFSQAIVYSFTPEGRPSATPACDGKQFYPDENVWMPCGEHELSAPCNA
jgi:hypothetical protein